MVTSRAVEVLHLSHKFDVGCMSKKSAPMVIKIASKSDQTGTHKIISSSSKLHNAESMYFNTPPIKLMAFSCKSWILSTTSVVKHVFSNCIMQLSDKCSIVNKSLKKPRMVHSF